MRELNGLGLMHGMLRNGLKGDADMLIAATEAVWKAITNNPENVSWYEAPASMFFDICYIQ